MKHKKRVDKKIKIAMQWVVKQKINFKKKRENKYSTLKENPDVKLDDIGI